MTFTRYASFLMFLLLLTSTNTPVVGQGVVDDTPDSPFVEMLARVPNTPASIEGEMYYYDHAAVVEAFPPAQIPANYAEFDANDGDNIPVEIYWRLIRNRGAGVFRMQQAFSLAEDMPEAVGFDYFAVRQEFAFGAPPTDGAILAGEFDLDAVRAAFAANDFEQQAGDVELWCWVEGCDRGEEFDFEVRNPANPFGGDFGRRQPLVITEGALFSTAGLEVAEDYVAAQNGDLNTLADDPRYIAASEALLDQGILMQAIVLDTPRVLEFAIPDLGLPPDLPPEQRERIVAELWPDGFDDFVELPPYQLVIFADIMREDTQDATIALVYNDESAAQTGGDVAISRLYEATSLRTRQPWRDILEDRLIFNVTADVVDAGDGLYVTLIRFPTARVPGDQVIAETEMTRGETPGSPDLTAPGLGFHLLTQSFFSRDLAWLNIATRAQYEEFFGD